jgi:3-oxoadipate enol-lactonase
MPFADLKNARLWYEVDGPESGPLLVLSHSLGMDLSLWDAVFPRFTTEFRVLRYDTRGHGRTGDGSQPLPLTIETLADDVVGLLDHVSVKSAFFCGVSLGGLTGMMVALRHQNRIRRAVLSNTAARIGTFESWGERISAVETGGLSSVVDAVLERSFTAQYRSTQIASVERVRKTMLTPSPEGYLACCAVLRDADLREKVSGIGVRCLAMTGSEDPATTVEDARFLAEHIPEAAYALLPGAHLCCIERPDEFANAVLSFLGDANA